MVPIQPIRFDWWKVRRHALMTMLAAAAIPALASPAAAASMRMLAHAGSWKAFSAIADDDHNLPVCGVAYKGLSGRLIIIKLTFGDMYLNMQIIKESWQIPDGTHLGIRLNIGNNAPWSVNTIGTGQQIVAIIQDASVQRFLDELRHSSTMTIKFSSGDEQEWVTSLNGLPSMLGVVGRCIQDMNPGPPRPTQPYSEAPAGPRPSSLTEEGPSNGSPVSAP